MRASEGTEHTTAVVIDVNQERQERIRLVLRQHEIEVVAGSAAVERSAELADIYACDLLVVGVGEDVEAKLLYRLLRKAHNRCPGLTSVVVAEARSPALLEAALAAGASSVVDWPATVPDLAGAIRAVLSENGRDLAAEGGGRCRLTRRELEILRLVAEGRSNRQVARLLWVSDQTVKFHLANIYRKLAVSNRREASEWAIARGLVELEPVLADECASSASSFRSSDGPVAVLP